MRTGRLGAALLVSAAVLAACGDDGGETTASTEPAESTQPASPAAPAEGTAPHEGPEVLQFEAATVAGGQLAGGDLAGQDLALWFWAPW